MVESIKKAIVNRNNFAPFLRQVVPLPSTLYPLPFIYCKGVIRGTFKVAYKRTSYFTGTEDLTKPLPLEVQIAPRNNIVAATATGRSLPTKTGDPILFEWRHVQGERVGTITLVNWSAGNVGIELDDSQGSIKVFQFDNKTFDLLGCGQIAGEDYYAKYVNLVCPQDEVYTPETLIVKATGAFGTENIILNITCREDQGG